MFRSWKRIHKPFCGCGDVNDASRTSSVRLQNPIHQFEIRVARLLRNTRRDPGDPVTEFDFVKPGPGDPRSCLATRQVKDEHPRGLDRIEPPFPSGGPVLVDKLQRSVQKCLRRSDDI